MDDVVDVARGTEGGVKKEQEQEAVDAHEFLDGLFLELTDGPLAPASVGEEELEERDLDGELAALAQSSGSESDRDSSSSSSSSNGSSSVRDGLSPTVVDLAPCDVQFDGDALSDGVLWVAGEDGVGNDVFDKLGLLLEEDSGLPQDDLLLGDDLLTAPPVTTRDAEPVKPSASKRKRPRDDSSSVGSGSGSVSSSSTSPSSTKRRMHAAEDARSIGSLETTTAVSDEEAASQPSVSTKSANRIKASAPKPPPPGLSPEELRKFKKEQKKARNRQLAAESRERRKQRMQNLEKENRMLRTRVKDLEKELAQLKDHKSSDSLPTSMVRSEKRRAADGNHNSVVKGTKMGTAAMVMSMSMVVLTDSSEDYSQQSGASEMISFWAIGWDLFSSSGLSLQLMLPHFLTLIFGTTLTVMIISLYYFRTLNAKRHILHNANALFLPLTTKGKGTSSTGKPLAASDAGVSSFPL